MKVPLYEQIYSYIIDEIREGRLKPGSRVPSEKELAEQFQVSRITSKKALEKLVSDLLIERIRGKGSFVAAGVTPEQAQKLSVSGSLTADQSHSGKIIALLLPDFAESYGLRLVKAVEQRLKEYGYYMLMFRTCGERKEEDRAIEACLELGVDGMIIFPVHGEYYNDRILRLVLDRFPLVLVDRYLKGIPVGSVFTDNYQAAFELTSYLMNLGHQRIAFVSPPANGTSTIEDRLRGIGAAITGRGLRFSQEDCLTDLYCTLPGAFNLENIQKDEQTILRFLESHADVTALVACEYNIARVLLHVLQTNGRLIPDNISIVCFDSPEYPLGVPQFTYIRQDEESMGRIAVDSLLKQTAGEFEPVQCIVDFSLVEGMSVRPIAGA